jgi:hypothetical protein
MKLLLRASTYIVVEIFLKLFKVVIPDKLGFSEANNAGFPLGLGGRRHFWIDKLVWVEKVLLLWLKYLMRI